MDVVSFISLEETDKDLILSFALDIGEGDVKTLLFHRAIFFEFVMPEEERGTKVSLEDDDLGEEEYMNTLECVTFDDKIMNIKARFSYHEIDLRKLQIEEIEQIKVSLALHNYDDRFEVKFT